MTKSSAHSTVLLALLAGLLGIPRSRIQVAYVNYKDYKTGKNFFATRFSLPISTKAETIPLRVFFFETESKVYLSDGVSFTDEALFVNQLPAMLKKHLDVLKSLS